MIIPKIIHKVIIVDNGELPNNIPFQNAIDSFKSLNKDEKVAKVALRLALISWIAGSLLSSITAIYLLSENIQIVANFFYLFFLSQTLLYEKIYDQNYQNYS